MTPNYYLGLDTGTDVCSVCVAEDENILAVRNSGKTFNHAAVITKYIDECLNEAGITLQALSAVFLSSGPGSFTGLRVGASTAKGLCFGAGLPLIAVDALTSLAYGCENPEANSVIVPLIDARRNDVYGAIFDHQYNILCPPTFFTLNNEYFHEYKNRKMYFCGDGSLKFESQSQLSNTTFLHNIPSATYLLTPGIAAFKKKQFENLSSFAPFYLNKANVTISKKKLV